LLDSLLQEILYSDADEASRLRQLFVSDFK